MPTSPWAPCREVRETGPAARGRGRGPDGATGGRGQGGTAGTGGTGGTGGAGPRSPAVRKGRVGLPGIPAPPPLAPRCSFDIEIPKAIVCCAGFLWRAGRVVTAGGARRGGGPGADASSSRYQEWGLAHSNAKQETKRGTTGDTMTKGEHGKYFGLNCNILAVKRWNGTILSSLLNTRVKL